MHWCCLEAADVFALQQRNRLRNSDWQQQYLPQSLGRLRTFFSWMCSHSDNIPIKGRYVNPKRSVDCLKGEPVVSFIGIYLLNIFFNVFGGNFAKCSLFFLIREEKRAAGKQHISFSILFTFFSHYSFRTLFQTFFFVNQVYSLSLSICQSSILSLALILQASAELQSVSDFYSSRVSHPSSLISLTFLTDLSQQRPMLMFEAEPGWALGIHGNHGDPCPRCSSNWAPRKLPFYDFVLRWFEFKPHLTWLILGNLLRCSQTHNHQMFGSRILFNG